MFSYESLGSENLAKEELVKYLDRVKYILRPIKVIKDDKNTYKVYLDNRGNVVVLKDLRVVKVSNISRENGESVKVALLAAHGDAHGLVAAAGSFFRLRDEGYAVRLLFGKVTGDVKLFWEKTFYSIPFECYDIVVILDIPEKMGRILPTNTVYIDHHGTGLKVDEVFYGEPDYIFKRLALLADHEDDPKSRDEELLQLGLSIAPFEPKCLSPELRAIEAVDRLIDKDFKYFMVLGQMFESTCIEISKKAEIIESTALVEFPQNFEFKLIWSVLHYIRLKNNIKAAIGFKRVKNNIYQINIVSSEPLNYKMIAKELGGTNLLVLSSKALSLRVKKNALNKLLLLAKCI